MSTKIEWSALRYPCDNPENGPARRNPVNGCVSCGTVNGDHYNHETGQCDACEHEGRPIPSAAPIIKREKPKSRPDRWAAALDALRIALDQAEAALSDLADVRNEYTEWHENLPENLGQSALGEKLEAIVSLEEPDSVLDTAREFLDEAEGLDLPRGFGRD